MLNSSRKTPWSPWSPGAVGAETGERGPVESIHVEFGVVDRWEATVGAYERIRLPGLRALRHDIGDPEVVPGGDVVTGPDRGITLYRRRWSGVINKGAVGWVYFDPS